MEKMNEVITSGTRLLHTIGWVTTVAQTLKLRTLTHKIHKH